MASTCFFARVSLPALLLAQPPPHAVACRLWHGAARSSHRVVVAAASRRTLGSVRYGTAAPALRAEVEVPPSVPVRVAYELQLAGHRYLDVRTEGEFGGGHPAGAVNVPYMYSTGSGRLSNPFIVEYKDGWVHEGILAASSQVNAKGWHISSC